MIMATNDTSNSKRSSIQPSAGAGGDDVPVAAGKQEGKAQEEKTTTPTHPTRARKKRKHRPEEFPKRPLSAYNIFFKETRERLLSRKASGQEDDEDDGVKPEDKSSMVKHIASLWKAASTAERARVDHLAQDDLHRYREEVKEYEENLVLQNQKERKEAKRAKEMKVQEEQGVASPPSAIRMIHGYPRQQSSRMRGESSGGGVSDRPSLHNKRRIIEDDMDRLIAEEISALDLAKSLRLRQLKFARQAHQSNPRSHLLDSLDAKRIALGLSPLMDTAVTSATIEATERERYEAELMRATMTPGRGGGSRLPAGLPSLHRPPNTSTIDQHLGLHAFPPAGRSAYSHMLRHPDDINSQALDSLSHRREDAMQEEALLRLRLQNYELMSSMQQPPPMGFPPNLHPNGAGAMADFSTMHHQHLLGGGLGRSGLNLLSGAAGRGAMLDAGLYGSSPQGMAGLGSPHLLSGRGRGFPTLSTGIGRGRYRSSRDADGALGEGSSRS